jgi:CRISPR-associated exonuclease, Cas4 family
MDLETLKEIRITGLKVNYYYICKRKLWLFSKNLSFEKNNDKIILGQILHENYYRSEKERDILIQELISIDIVDDDYIREVKSSDKMEKADIMQVVYYLYVLKQLGIEKVGFINYPKQKKKKEVHLTKQLEQELLEALKDIEKIVDQPNPPKLEKLPYCKKCSYFEFCFA